MNILITGINGLVGKGIASILSQYHNIIGLSKAKTNNSGLSINYLSVDISNPIETDFLNDLNFELIIHCAASLDKNPLSLDLLKTNCNGIRNISEIAIEKNCKIIYISGIPIIGIPTQIPITELHPVNPISNYHLTKYFGEIFLSNVLKKENLTILRLSSPIGYDLPINKILSVLIQRALKNEDINLLGKGKRVQNYINVKDIGFAVEKIIDHDISGLYNIAHNKSYSNKDLAALCIAVLSSNSKINYRGEDPEEDHQWIISIEKAIKAFNFHPKISMEQSILEIAEKFNK
jgi:UDP-glucose 4-epimerase